MKTKFFKLITILCFIFFASSLNVNAAILSDSDVMLKMSQAKSIVSYDLISLINKNELIGYRLENFNLHTLSYKNNVNLAVERLNNIKTQIDIVRNSSDYSDSDKILQTNKLYQDADATLYDLDAKTITYLVDLRRIMPSISYQRYVKKFLQYYNSLKLTDTTLEIY